MNTTNSFKLAAPLLGAALSQAGLFACYLANTWRHPAALLLIALIPVCILIRTYQCERNWFSGASSVTGMIIGRQKKSQFGQLWDTLTVVYVIDATTYTYPIHCSPYAPQLSVGDSVRLFYKPTNPALAREQAVFLDNVLPWVALTLSAIALITIALNDADTLLSLTGQ